MAKPRAPTSLFLAYCPDRIAAGVVETRLKVRAQHFADFKADNEAGHCEFGRAILPPPGSPLHSSPLFPPGVQPMGGSVMFLRYPSLDDAWARIKRDVYWTNNIWDHERTVVEQFCEPPPVGTVKGVDTAPTGSEINSKI